MRLTAGIDVRVVTTWVLDIPVRTDPVVPWLPDPLTSPVIHEAVLPAEPSRSATALGRQVTVASFLYRQIVR